MTADICFASCTSLRAYGGAEKWIVTVGNELSERGHEITIKALPFQPFETGITQQELENMMHPDVTYTEAWRPRIQAPSTYFYYQPLAWKLFRCKSENIIAGIHSPGLQPSTETEKFSESVRKTWFKTISLKRMSNFDGVHILNSSSEQLNSLKNSFVIPNWVDMQKFHPGNTSEKFSSEKGTDIGFVQRRPNSKGQHIVEKVAEHLDSPHHHFHSTGPQFSKNVKSHGFIPESQYPEFLASMDILIHPSKRDCFSLTVLEALSSGTPVIAKPIEPTKQVNSQIYFAESTDEYIDKIRDIKRLLKGRTLSDKLRKSAEDYKKQEIIGKLEKRLTNGHH